MDQEKIAIAIVVIATASLLLKFYRGFVAGALANVFLRLGYVKTAMRLRGQVLEKGCSKCGASK